MRQSKNKMLPEVSELLVSYKPQKLYRNKRYSYPKRISKTDPMTNQEATEIIIIKDRNDRPYVFKREMFVNKDEYILYDDETMLRNKELKDNSEASTQNDELPF